VLEVKTVLGTILLSISILFMGACAESEPAPGPVPVPAPSPSPTPVPVPAEEQEITFAQLLANPDRYSGTEIIIEGFYYNGFETIVLSENLKDSGIRSGTSGA
jgi:hypothetical protein